MAVIFWAVGGVIATAAMHEDHSAHSAYGDYDNYSDAAERKRKRRESMKPGIEDSARELSNYKHYTVNPQLDSQALKDTSAMRVDVGQMDSDVNSKLGRVAEIETRSQTGDLQKELEEIDSLLEKISQMEKEAK